MKIIGNTVGMGLPKPNLMQNDPSKGDFVKGREEFAKQFSGSGGDSVQPDLAQNDPSQPDYVKNRTHWEVAPGGAIEWEGTALGTNMLTKISDLTPTLEQFFNGTCVVKEIAETENVLSAWDIKNDFQFEQYENKAVLFSLKTGSNALVFAIIYETITEDVEYEPGFYAASEFWNNAFNNRISQSSSATAFRIEVTYLSIVNKLDPKFLPEGGFGWEENNQTVIEWDGSTEGLEVLLLGDGMYKVSDNTPTVVALVGGEVATSVDQRATIEENNLEDLGDGMIIFDGVLAVLNLTADDREKAEAEGTTLPSNGLYFSKTSDFHISSLTYGFTTVHHLDEKFIPDTIARTADIPDAIPMPPTASAGQFIVVTSVDENGKVTATEAVTLADAEEVAF